MRFRKIYFDGQNGWCLGDLVEYEVNIPDDDEMYVEIDGKRYGSIDGDMIFEIGEEGDILLIPCE